MERKTRQASKWRRVSLHGGGARRGDVCVFLLRVAIVLWPLIEQLSEAN